MDSSVLPYPHPYFLAFWAGGDSSVENTALGQWGTKDSLDPDLSSILLTGRTHFQSPSPSCSASPGRDLEPGLGVRPRASITSTSSWPLRSMMATCTSPAREKRDSPGRARRATVQNARLQGTTAWKGHEMKKTACGRTGPWTHIRAAEEHNQRSPGAGA